MTVREVPLWSALTVTAAAVVVVQAARPLDDPDVWWHVRAGDQVLSSGRVPHTETWVWTALGRRWVPTSWLSDVALALAHRAGGWQGVRVLSVGVAVLFVVLLGRQVHRIATPVGAAIAFAVVAVATAGYLRERPQAASLCLMVVLAAWCQRTREGQPPSWYVVAVVTWLWACLHGMWILVPGALLLSGASAGRATLRAVLPAAGASVIVSLLTPVGPRLALQPFVVADRARDIAEWAPVDLASWSAVYLVLLAVLLASVPQQSRLFVAGVLVFACLAVRNVAPAAVLLSPLLAAQLSAGLPRSTSSVPRFVPLVLLGVSGAAALSLLVSTDPVSTAEPQRLVAALDRDRGAHVLVDYDVGGLVTGEARHVSAAVDGRTDIYDPRWLHDYLRLTERRGDWRGLLATLRPSRALLVRDSTLAVELTADGWRVDDVEGRWALLSPPAP